MKKHQINTAKKIQYLLALLFVVTAFSTLDAYTYIITNSTDHEIDFSVKVSFAKSKSITLKPKDSGKINFKGIACLDYVSTKIKDPSDLALITESVQGCGNREFEVLKGDNGGYLIK